jgi:hypothetical protein
MLINYNEKKVIFKYKKWRKMINKIINKYKI